MVRWWEIYAQWERCDLPTDWGIYVIWRKLRDVHGWWMSPIDEQMGGAPVDHNLSVFAALEGSFAAERRYEQAANEAEILNAECGKAERGIQKYNM